MIKSIDLKLSASDARSLVFLIRKRQDDVRKVTFDMPTYEVYNEVDIELELLKNRLLDQCPVEIFSQ